MGLYDRPYMRDDHGVGYGGGGGVRIGLPRPGRTVMRLLVINLAVFVLQIFMGNWLLRWFAAVPVCWWQVWRYVTFQFLHGGLFHLMFNMLGLYFLGMVLEKGWGGRRFLVFYLTCGAAAGAAHVIMSMLFNQSMSVPLLGASGGVYGVVLACAILYPQIRVFVFLFLMPIRVAAGLFLGFAVLNVLIGVRSAIEGGPLSAGGISDMAHLGGALAGGVWVWLMPKLRGTWSISAGKVKKGAWGRKMARRAAEQAQIDRILRKIHAEGLESLSRKEREILREATHRQRDEERDLYR